VSKLSYKSLLIIFFFLLIGIVVLVKFVLPKQIVKAAWWNDGWSYRQAINISSHTTTQSNVYITTSINIGTTAKTQIDDGDFRFVNQNGELLSYYLVSGVGTTNITFHIQLSNFPAGSQIIYAYYGNFSVENGFSLSDFTTLASNYTIGSLSSEETGGGPIAYWKFDEGVGTTIYDSSSNQNNGILGAGNSSPAWTNESECISGKCLYFNGSTTYAVLTKNLSPAITTDDFTIEAWIKPTSLTSAWKYLINQGGSGIVGYGLAISNTNQFSADIQGSGGTNQHVYDSNTSLSANKWFHVVASYNRDGNVDLYVNGVLKKSTSITGNTGNVFNSSYKLNFGAFCNLNPAVFFQGYMDEVRIYPYARTTSQIKLDYNSRGSLQGSSVNLGTKSSTGPDLNSKLIAYYKFDEGSDLIAHDSIGGHDAILAGSTTPSWQNSDQCKSGKCLYFNGVNSFVNAGTSPDLTPQSISVEAWVKPTTFVSSWMGIISNMTSWGTGFGLQLGTSQKIAAMISGTYLTTTWTPSLNKWYHIVATHNSSTNQNILYVNGIKESISTQAISYESNAKTYIGVFYTSPNLFFNGYIDEVKIYNTALTDDEVKQDFNQGSAISFGSTNQTIGGTTTSLNYCIPGDTSYCASPVAEWNFEENTGTIAKDTSSNNNFTFNAGTSAPTWTVGKKNTGSALNFNGDSNWVQRTLSPPITAATDYSQCLWFNSSTNATRQVMIDDANQWEHWIAINTNKTIMGCYYNTTQICTTSTATINLNTWNHVCLSVQSGQKMSLYLNGSLVSQNTNIGSSLPKIYDDICIGANGGSTHGEKLTGKIDDVKIYNYARTPAQVAYDYNKGAPVGWWKLDECQRPIINDSSGIGNTGSINIGPSGTQSSAGTCTTSGTAWGNGASGYTNSSLNFDGIDDYVNFGDPANGSLDFGTNDFSMSTWIKTSSSQRGTIFGKYYDYPLFYLRLNADGKIESRLGFNISTNYTSTDGTTVNNNIWHQIIVVYKRNGNMTRYLDGKVYGIPLNISASSNLSIDTSGSLILGASTASQFFQGQIDDARIYNYALTAEQVKQLYNGGSVSFN